MSTATIDVARIRERLETSRRDAHRQIDLLDLRVAQGHELTDDQVKSRLNFIGIVSDCNEAMLRLDLETYGLCQQCDGPIESERLELFPYVARCMACKKSGGEGSSTRKGEGSTTSTPPSPSPQDEMSDEAGASGRKEEGGLPEVLRTPASPAHRSTAEDRAGDAERSRPCEKCGEMIPGHLVREFDAKLCLGCVAPEGGLPRTECPVCHRSVPIRRGGELREHTLKPGEPEKCPASGLRPARALVEAPSLVATAPEHTTSTTQPETQPVGAGAKDKQFADLPIPHANRGGAVDQVPVEQITPDPNNPRSDVGDVSDLQQSIRSLSLLQPLVVRKNDNGGYHIIAGHRRFAAVTAEGWSHVPVVVFNYSDSETLEAQLIENIHRSDLTALDEAKAYQQLIDVHGMSQRELSDRIGRSQSHISKRIALLDLPEETVALVDSGGITLEGAQEFLKLKDHPSHLAKALKNFGTGESNYWTPERCVAEQMRDVRAVATRKKAREKAQKEGLTVMAEQKFTDIDYKKRAEIGKGYSDLEVDPQSHKTEPCHRVVIGFRGRNGMTHVCIDVDRHKKKGASTLKGLIKESSSGPRKSPEQLDLERHYKDLERVQTARRQFSEALIKGKLPSKDDIVSLMALGLADLSELPAAHDLCQFLGVKARHPEAGVKLREFTSKSPDNAERAVFAAALHVNEAAISVHGLRYRTAWDSPTPWADAEPFLAFLEKKGYDASIEREEIRKEKEKAAAADVPSSASTIVRRSGTQRPKKATARKSPARKKTSAKKATAGKKAVTARKSTAARKSTVKSAKGRKRAAAKRATARKLTARKKTRR